MARARNAGDGCCGKALRRLLVAHAESPVLGFNERLAEVAGVRCSDGNCARVETPKSNAARGSALDIRGASLCAIKDGVDGLANVSARLLTRETSVGSSEGARRAIGRIRSVVAGIAAAAAVDRSGGKHRNRCQQGDLAKKARNQTETVTTHGARGSSIYARTVAQHVPALSARLYNSTFSTFHPPNAS